MRMALKMGRLLGVGFSMSLRRTLAYRTNLLFDTLLAAVGLISTLGTVLVVFTQTNTLAGWTEPDMFVLIGTFQLLTGIKATFIDPNLSWFPGRGIRDGRLDAYLLQPAPSLFLTSCGMAAPLAATQILLGLGVVVLGVSQHGRPPSLYALAAWLLLITIGTAIAWAIGVLLACMAFWAPKLELEVLYGAVWQLGRYPVDIYRRPLRFVLTYVFPLALVATRPASALLRQPEPLVVLTSAGGGGLAVLLAIGAWRLGLRRYTGATS
jgi:ABC-2 type transport system permease protein